MIKVLFFIESLSGGGAEKVLCNLVNEMDQSQFEITVQTLWKVDASRYLNPGIQYRYCYASKTRLNSYRHRIEAAAGLTYPLHIKGDYDIEVAFLECGATKIMSASTNKKAKKVAWVHCDLELKMADPTAFSKKSANWYRSFDRIVCVSQSVKESFDRLFRASEKTLVLYNTIDDTEIRNKANVTLPEMPQKRKATVVTLGRLSPEKAYDRLLKIHKKLVDCGFDYDLWVLGEGEERKKLETYIAENHLYDSVKLFGYCSNPYPYVKTADLIVCSSRYEGMSTFITEGLILGKPIVTTKCSGMQELLGDSEYGLIVENTDEALLEGMRKMLSSPDLCKEYAEAASKRGLDFSARQLTANTEQFFLNLLDET